MHIKAVVKLKILDSKHEKLDKVEGVDQWSYILRGFLVCV